MSRAEELAGILDRVGPDFSKLMKAITGDPEHYLTDVAAELRRLSAVEAELAECKAAYESQFKELHSLKSTLAASCDDEREQLWEATPGGGCSRALDAERELEALKKAIGEAEPVAWRAEHNSGDWALREAPTTPSTGIFTGHIEPLYTLKGIKQ